MAAEGQSVASDSSLELPTVQKGNRRLSERTQGPRHKRVSSPPRPHMGNTGTNKGYRQNVRRVCSHCTPYVSRPRYVKACLKRDLREDCRNLEPAFSDTEDEEVLSMSDDDVSQDDDEPYKYAEEISSEPICPFDTEIRAVMGTSMDCEDDYVLVEPEMSTSQQHQALEDEAFELPQREDADWEWC